MKCCTCGLEHGEFVELITVGYTDGHPDETYCRECFDGYGVAGLGGIERD